MSRIMIIANDETTIHHFRMEIISAFINAGHTVIVCYPFAEHTAEIRQSGAKLINLKVSRHGMSILQDTKLVINCVALIKRFMPDIVLTYTIKPNVYGSIACQITGTSYINNVTGLGSIVNSDGFKSRIMTKIIFTLQKIGYRESSCVFFQNEENRKTLVGKHVIDKRTETYILPGSGVNLEQHKYEPYPENDGIVRFIIVSRLRADKGYDEYLYAAEKIKKKYPGTEFHIVGWIEEERYRERVKHLESEGIIIFHGEKTQDEVHMLIKNCNCLVHPSYHEGMSNVLLEAAAAGRPVIASNIPGCRETFDEGLSGYGFECKNRESLVTAIEKYMKMPYNEQILMGKAGRVKMEREFDRKIVADIYLKKIESVVGE